MHIVYNLKCLSYIVHIVYNFIRLSWYTLFQWRREGGVGGGQCPRALTKEGRRASGKKIKNCLSKNVAKIKLQEVN